MLDTIFFDFRNFPTFGIMNVRSVLFLIILTIFSYGLSSTSSKKESGPKLTKDEVLKAMYEQLSDYCYSYLHDGSEYSDFKEYHYYNLSFRSEFPHLVIYNGRTCPGFESNLVEFFDFHNGQLDKFFWFTGQLLRWKKNQFRIHHSPCCAEIIDAIVDFEFSKDSINKIIQHESHLFFDNFPLEKMEELISAKHISAKVNDSLVCYYTTNSEIHPHLPSSFQNRKLMVLNSGSSYEVIESIHAEGLKFIRCRINADNMNQIRVPIYEHLVKSQTVWIYGWIED